MKNVVYVFSTPEQKEGLRKAFCQLQDAMQGDYEKLGCPSDEEIVQMVKELRREQSNEKQSSL